LQALLLERGHDLNSALACAINNHFVPRAQWPSQPLQAGDRVDVIAPITGG
jgi:sulfur carrier protein